MRRRIAIAVLLVAATCGGEKPPDFYPAEGVRKTREAMASAKSFVIYEVANEFDEDYARFRGKPRILQYPIRRKKTLRREIAAPLVAKLTAPDTYMRNDQWSCIFEPHHVIEMPRMTLVVCVACGDVEFVVDGKKIDHASVLPAPNDELTKMLAEALR